MTDSWLRLRHSIAHGHPKLSVEDVLESVRSAIDTWRAAHPAASHGDAMNHFKAQQNFDPRLRLTDAKRCVVRFRRLARLTAQNLAMTAVGPNVW